MNRNQKFHFRETVVLQNSGARRVYSYFNRTFSPNSSAAFLAIGFIKIGLVVCGSPNTNVNYARHRRPQEISSGVRPVERRRARGERNVERGRPYGWRADRRRRCRALRESLRPLSAARPPRLPARQKQSDGRREITLLPPDRSPDVVS